MKTYYVGSIPVSDGLYHHGIKGQKWGIRRYQNPDGTLTTAGKERYGSDREQKKFAKKVIDHRSNLRNTPQVKHAVANLQNEAKAMRVANKRYDDEVERFYNNKKLYDEFVGKEADYILTHNPNIAKEYRESSVGKIVDAMSDKDVVKKAIKDGELGNPLSYFEHSGDKRAETLFQAHQECFSANNNLNKASRKYAKMFLGDYGNQDYKIRMRGFPNGLKSNVESTVAKVIYSQIRYK